MSPFSPINYDRVAWKPTDSGGSSPCYSQEVHCDDVPNGRAKGEQSLFLGFQITLSAPISTSGFIALVGEAWRTLRFDIPTIAARPQKDDTGHTFITYRVAKNSQEVKDWSSRTVRIHGGAKDLDELRYELGQHRTLEENVILHVHPEPESRYGFLLHAEKSLFDDAGLKIVANEFLARLSKITTTPALAPTEYLPWGTENKNLTVLTSAITSSSEPTSGAMYDQSLRATAEALDFLAVGAIVHGANLSLNLFP